MSLVALCIALAAAGQTTGPEQLVGWSLGACWWDCGDLGSDFGGTMAYHWPTWLVQLSYAEPDDSWHNVRLDAEIWGIEAFRLWRAHDNPLKPSWIGGIGAGFYDVGVDSFASGLKKHDTDSDWAAVGLVGFRWPSGWYVLAEYVLGADISINTPGGRQANLDMDGLRFVVGRRF